MSGDEQVKVVGELSQHAVEAIADLLLNRVLPARLSNVEPGEVERYKAAMRKRGAS